MQDENTIKARDFLNTFRELIHFINHTQATASPEFWAEVERISPEYEEEMNQAVDLLEQNLQNAPKF
jgi:hypothetical protein